VCNSIKFVLAIIVIDKVCPVFLKARRILVVVPCVAVQGPDVCAVPVHNSVPGIHRSKNIGNL
jgi:hypothetical protein